MLQATTATTTELARHRVKSPAASSSKMALTVAAAALSAAASAQGAFVYASATRSISLTSPSGTSGVTSSVLGDFLEFRSYSAPSVSGSLQQASTLGADSMSVGAFAQMFSNSGGFGGPLSGTSSSTISFVTTTQTIASLSVGTTLQGAGAGSSRSVSVVLRDATTNTVLYSSSTAVTDTVDFVLSTGTTYELTVNGNASMAAGIGNAFMNTSVSITAVPAPGAIATFGLAALLRRRRR